MIVFDLSCQAGHVFEAWFSNSADYEVQRKKRLIACPLCNTTRVSKAVMAPNVAAKGNSGKETATHIALAADASVAQKTKEMLASLAKMQTEVLSKSEWVGRDFDSQARAMDAGEIDRKTIHGEVSKDEAKSLIEDGIGVMPLPFPVVPPSKRN
jgi:hypothetical protein